MKKLCLALACGALVLCGCQTPAPVSAPEPEPLLLSANVAPGVAVHYDHELVASALEVVRANINASGRLPKLTFQIRNKISQRYPIEYRIEWLDADGAPLMVSSAWQQVTLSGNAIRAVTSMGKSPDAKTVNIALRIPQPVEIFVPEPDPMEQMKMQEEYNRQMMQNAQQPQ